MTKDNLISNILDLLVLAGMLKLEEREKKQQEIIAAKHNHKALVKFHQEAREMHKDKMIDALATEASNEDSTPKSYHPSTEDYRKTLQGMSYKDVEKEYNDMMSLASQPPLPLPETVDPQGMPKPVDEPVWPDHLKPVAGWLRALGLLPGNRCHLVRAQEVNGNLHVNVIPSYYWQGDMRNRERNPDAQELLRLIYNKALNKGFQARFRTGGYIAIWRQN